MAKFADTFADYGFSWQTFAPAYGLAEYTLLISNKPKGTTQLSPLWMQPPTNGR
ncbi:MAG UNVERIFIED_CONTAM: hypothetical protein LVR29_18925 [Microcystis novacekii LVE1205-3]|jgi:hypothetical protein